VLATIGFAFLAGVFSTLSPCVLPLVPLVLGAAISEHTFGPFALAAGLALSFTAIGLFVATIGFAAGIDGDTFRLVGAILVTLIGFVLIVPRLQTQFSLASGPVTNWAERRFGGFSRNGLPGQFAVGALLGVVWSPCAGPTLGAASIMAARGENLLQVATTMILFGIGAAVPLLVLGLLSRETMTRVRGRLMATGQKAKAVMGAILIVVGALILTGYDKSMETVLVNNSPSWLTELTTQF
jgi:cytochrome c biogenesis protein CcdA